MYINVQQRNFLLHYPLSAQMLTQLPVGLLLPFVEASTTDIIPFPFTSMLTVSALTTITIHVFTAIYVVVSFVLRQHLYSSLVYFRK